MMFPKVIVLLCVWVLAALGVSDELEHRDAAPYAASGLQFARELDSRGMDDGALFQEFRKLLGRDYTTTITLPPYVQLPTPLADGGWTYASVVTVTIPGTLPSDIPELVARDNVVTGSIPRDSPELLARGNIVTVTIPPYVTLPTPLPSGGWTIAETLTLTVGSICEGSSSHASQPAVPPATVSSANVGSETHLSSTPHVTSVPSAQTSVPVMTHSTSAPPVSSGTTAKLLTTSAYSTEVESESAVVTTASTSAPIRSSSPSVTPAKSNALRNNGLGTAVLAMAVALGTLVAM